MTMLHNLLKGKEYVAIKEYGTTGGRVREFSLVFPVERYYNVPRYLVLWRGVRMILSALWRDLLQ